MKAKSHYLLDFCVLLTLFYLCNSCGFTAYFDSGDYHFKICYQSPDNEIYDVWLDSNRQFDCESAKAIVKSVGDSYEMLIMVFVKK